MADLEVDVERGIARFIINRPERRNAMSFDVMRLLSNAIDQAAGNESVRVVVITGAGDRAFSAGADLVGMATDASAADAHNARGLLAGVFRSLWRLEKPTIARVRGFALAGGFGLAMACDFVIASEDAQFGTPEIDVGLWPYMITVPLLRSMPPRFAFELMATGRRVQADEAARLGLVNRVVANDQLDANVNDLAENLASKSPLILGWGKRSFHRALDMDPDSALDYLQSMLSLTVLTEDTAEGLAAFAEKRKPKWRGR